MNKLILLVLLELHLLDEYFIRSKIFQFRVPEENLTSPFSWFFDHIFPSNDLILYVVWLDHSRPPYWNYYDSTSFYSTVAAISNSCILDKENS